MEIRPLDVCRDEIINLDDSSSRASVPCSTPDDPFQTGFVSVSVFDPRQQGDGINAALYYRVESKYVESNGANRQHSVQRRFSDFAWLRSNLRSSYLGCIVPPLPTKSVLGAKQQSFIEKRIRGLQYFMNRVISHSQLRSSVVLDTFLKASETEFELVKSPRLTAAEQSLAAASHGIMNIFQQTLHTVQSSLRHSPVVEKSSEQLQWEATQEYMNTLQKHASLCLNSFEIVANCEQDLAQARFDMGLGLSLFAELEKETEQLVSSHSLAENGNAFDRVSVLSKHHIENDASVFKEPLKDLIRTIDCVQESLAARQRAHSNLAGLEYDLISKKLKLEDAKARRTSTKSKIEELENQIIRIEKELTDAKSLLSSITKDLSRDLAEFKSEKSETLANITRNFIAAQVDFSQKVFASWQSASDELARLSLR